MTPTSNWPLYFKDKLILNNLDSHVGVITLWMPKESVSQELVDGSYSVCGQLYTKRGINPLLRNILANPKIRYLVMCGLDRQGSGEALTKFFKNGVVEAPGKSGALEGWRIIGDDEALLDKEITLEALNLVRHNVELLDMRMKPLNEVATAVKGLPLKPAFSDPHVFAQSIAPVVSRAPSDMSVFKIRKDYIGDAWIDVLKVINKFGAEIPGMYGKVREVHNLCVVIEKEDPLNPKIDEFLKFRKDGLDHYIKGFFDKDKGAEAYTYGERIFDWDGIDQEKLMVEKLSRFPFDRGAMAVLWKTHVDNFPPSAETIKKDGQTKGWKVPCLVMVLGQCIDNNFHMTAVFRNNDMYGAWPLNAFALREFQRQLSTKIGKNLGSLTTISHIAEMYEMDFEDSLKTVKENDSMGRTCMYDPRGYYTISIEDVDIVATFFTPDGSTQLAQFRRNGNDPKVARDMCAMAIQEMLISDLGAAADLGRQLAKAETAVKLNLMFMQDQPLKFH